jgi:tetratricopeptide (TPR) repeat protein
MIETFSFNSKLYLKVAVITLIGMGFLACGSDYVPITTSSDESRDLYIQARDLVDKFNRHESKELLEKAIKLDSTFASSYLLLSFLQDTYRDHLFYLEKAISLADRVSDGERWMILAAKAQMNGFSLQQKEYNHKLAEAYPRDEFAHIGLANYYFFIQRDYQKAVEIYNKAIAINPEYSLPYNQIGYCYRFLEKYKEAEDAFKKYIKLVPDSPNPYDSYAELLLRMGEFEVSIEYYEKALTIDSTYQASHRGIATNLVLMRKYQEAYRQIKELYRMADNYTERRFALFIMAVSLIDEGKFDKALSVFERRYTLAATNSDTVAMVDDLNLIGMALLQMEKVDKAEHNIARSIELIERSGLSQDIKNRFRQRIPLYKGLVSVVKQDLKSATRYSQEYKQAVNNINNPNQIRASHALEGLIALKEHAYEKAITEFEQADQLNPYIIYLMAQAYEGKGNKEKAIELYEKTANFNSLIELSYAFVREKAELKLAELRANPES